MEPFSIKIWYFRPFFTKMTLTFQNERSRSFPFLQLQIPYGKHIWNIKLYERKRIVIITKMATIDMHRLFLLSWLLTFDLDLQTFGKKFATTIFEMYSSIWTFWYITTLINKEKPRDDISNCTICEIEFEQYEPRHEKMCLRKSPTRPDTNRPVQPQKLARVLKFRL